jgi:Zn-dependent M28 family amino/carboxypeptidase
LEGTDKKDEVIVITAHYDHLGKKDTLIYYGADDDGSGTSAVMEMAKVFSDAAREGHRPRRSILFMTVSGEEKGLLGSSYYVTHPLLPLSKTVANLNIDMIGRTDKKHDSLGVRDYVYIIGSDKLSTQLHKINHDLNTTFTKMELDYTFNKPDDPNRFYYRSDHYNFAKNNIPIIFYFNGVHKDYHKPTDTFDKIQFDLLAKRAQLVFLTAWELANREERIKVDVKSDMPPKKE